MYCNVIKMNEINFRPTEKQFKAYTYLIDKKTTEIGYGGGAGCFIGTTLILTKTGYRPIKDITEGDYVMSYNESSRQLEFNRVLETFTYTKVQQKHRLVELTFKNGISVKATENHKFLFNGEWVEIGELINKRIQCETKLHKRCNSTQELEAREINLNEIINIKYTEPDCLVYDLMVEDNHSYVITRDNIIVHNSGKSFLGCFWLFSQCVAYPGVTYLMGRRELSNLKKTTLLSFFKLMRDFKIEPEDYFFLNSQLNIINFKNGSMILLMDMAHKPSDPDYLRFGGLELTGAFVDESNECDEKAISIIKTRLGRGLNKKYDITPKIFETFNPSKNHVYFRYYLPYKENSHDAHRTFIPSLATDNPYLPKSYIKQLEDSDEITRQRLLYGNFDYDDDDRALCSFDKIRDVFTNDFIEPGEKFTSSDLAMQGRDRFVVMNWSGLRGKFSIIKSKSTGKEIEEDLKQCAKENKSPRSNTIADSDGMGNYIESYMPGIKTFHAGASPRNKKEFNELKSECAFKLAEIINQGKLFLDIPNDKLVSIGGKERYLRSVVIEELSQLKRDNLDKDVQKKKLISKEEMKKNIGRSPDFLDVLLFRMYFEIKGTEIV